MEGGSSVLWAVTDRWGRDFELNGSSWYNHILPRHHALRGHEAAVAKVLTSPYRVTHDAVHPM